MHIVSGRRIRHILRFDLKKSTGASQSILRELTLIGGRSEYLRTTPLYGFGSVLTRYMKRFSGRYETDDQPF